MLMKHAFKNAFSLSISANITFSWFFLLVLYIKKHNFWFFWCIDVLILRILQERFGNSSVVEMDFHVLNFMIQTCSVGSSSKLHSSH